MDHKYLNIYNNLIKLTRNKNLYLNLERNDEFSDRLLFLMFHFALFLKKFKSEINKKKSQELFDFFVRQIELSIREIGYGDVSVNKKMKDYVNLFFSILENVEKWTSLNIDQKKDVITNLINIKENNNLIVNYFDKFSVFLSNNSLKIFTKDILELKF